MKKIKKILSLFTCSIMAFVPFIPAINTTFATETNETENGIVYVSVKYDKDITPAEGDEFVLEYTLEENQSVTPATITIDASVLQYDEGTIEMPANSYIICGITYNGQNQDIINQGYGCVNNFSNKSKDGHLRIAIGDESLEGIEKEYNFEVIGHSINYSEYGVPTRDYMSEKSTEWNKNPIPETPEEYESQLDKENQNLGENTSNPSGEIHIDENKTESGELQETENPITDNGEAKVENYLEDEEQTTIKTPAKTKTILGKFIGIVIFTVVGFGIIFYMHKQGKF